MRLSPFGLIDRALAPAPDPKRRRRPRSTRLTRIAACTATGRIENSRAAFEAAIAAGHGIELDVQASRDGEAIVFHDYELDRLTGVAGRGRRRAPRPSLARSRLRGTDETLPTLADMLAARSARGCRC